MPRIPQPPTWPCAATCTRGLEEVLAGELAGLGVAAVHPGRGVVRFAGTPRDVAAANLRLRTAMRVLVELGAGAAGSRQALYDLVAGVPWEEWVDRGQTIAVTAAGQGTAFAGTAFATLVVKDAVVDRLRARLGGWRPDVDKTSPDVRVWVHLAGHEAAVGVDSTGEPLSHRGYRPRGGPAPLAESLAAGILLLAGYDGSQPFLDPMCGTGTLAIEAALIAAGTAPGLGRTFACERWRLSARVPVEEERQRARTLRRRPGAPIIAGDSEPRACAAARGNAAAAGVGELVEVTPIDATRLPPLVPGTLVVANPPYGVRIGAGAELRALYRGIGESLRDAARGCTAWLLAGDPELLKAVPLRPSRRIVLFNGPIECRLVRYDIRAAGTPEGGAASQS